MIRTLWIYEEIYKREDIASSQVKYQSQEKEDNLPSSYQSSNKLFIITFYFIFKLNIINLIYMMVPQLFLITEILK